MGLAMRLTYTACSLLDWLMAWGGQHANTAPYQGDAQLPAGRGSRVRTHGLLRANDPAARTARSARQRPAQRARASLRAVVERSARTLRGRRCPNAAAIESPPHRHRSERA